MTDNQNRFYWRVWGEVRRVLLVSGFTPATADLFRHEIHVRALGYDKTHTAFNNHEFDRVLAVFYAYSQSDNLGLQLRQLNQPLTRAMGSIFAKAFLAQIGVKKESWEAYLNGIALRACKKPLMDLDDKDWPTILAALNHTRLHRAKAGHKHGKGRRPEAGGRGVSNLQAPASSLQPADEPF